MKKVKVFFKIIGKVLFFIGTVFLVLFGGLSALLSASVRWMFETWPNLSMQELMFQLQSPIEGTSKDMIDNYIESCVPVTVLMIFMIVIILISCRKRKKVYLAMTAVVLLTSGIIIVSDIHRVYARLEVKEYVVNRNTNSGFIDSNYVDPAETEISFPEQKRNLIYIFLESMETTYASKENGGAYDENYIPLDSLLSGYKIIKNEAEIPYGLVEDVIEIVKGVYLIKEDTREATEDELLSLLNS